jgi:hypothetical protein
MLGNLFRRSMDHKQRVDKEETVEIYSHASSGSQGNYMKYANFLWRRLETAPSIS